MKSAIMNLEYEEFIKHFTIEKLLNNLDREVYKNLLSHELYEKIEKHLSDEVKNVFTPIYNEYGDNSFVYTSLFRYDYNLFVKQLMKQSSIYSKEGFYKLKDILNNDQIINYQVSSVTDITKKYTDKYDLILFDNLLTYYQTFENCNEFNEIINYIENEVPKLLNQNGNLQATYLFEEGAYFFLKNINNIAGANMMEERILQLFRENELSYNLFAHKDNYKYDKISGVELSGNDNYILTKTKR